LQYFNANKKLPVNLTFSLACLFQFYKGTWNNEILPVKDSPEIVEAFKNAWQLRTLDLVVTKILSNTEFWGEDLTQINGLSEALVVALNEIETNGIENGFANYSKQF
jgi:tagaturonate reductase